MSERDEPSPAPQSGAIPAPPAASKPRPHGWHVRVRAARVWLRTNWPVWGSLVTLVGAVLFTGVSPLHPFNVIAHQQRTLEHEREKFAHEQADWDFAQTMARDHVALGERLLKAGQFKEAARAFEQAQTFDAADTQASWGLIRAGVYADTASGDYEPEVVRMRLDQVLARDPKDPVALTQMGNLVALQDQAEARDWFERAIAQDPEVPLAHFGLGVLLMDQGQPGAAAHLGRAVALSPWNLDALDNLAYTRLRKGEIERARAGYERALALDGERLSLYLGLAATERLAGRWEIALGSQEVLVQLIEDEQVRGQAKNKVLWHFLTDAGPIEIAHPAAQRALAQVLLALDHHLAGDAPGAQAAMAAAAGTTANGLPGAVRRLVNAEIRTLAITQPARAEALVRFAQRYLPVP